MGRSMQGVRIMVLLVCAAAPCSQACSQPPHRDRNMNLQPPALPTLRQQKYTLLVQTALLRSTMFIAHPR